MPPRHAPNPDRLDDAESRLAIEGLIFRYAELIDAGDFATLAELFAKARMLGPDGEVHGEGKEAIKSVYDDSTQLYEDGTPMTQHVTTNLIFTFSDDGRSAQVRSRFTVMQQLPDFPLQCIITGYYEDRFDYDDDEGWHFVERRMKPKLLGDLSRHLKFDLANA